MFKKISFITLTLIVAIIAAACAPQGIQLPALSQPSSEEQSNAAPGSVPGNVPQPSTQSAPPAPGNVPQAGQNGQGGLPNRGQAALLQMLNRLGWEGGVITKISDNQITLRAIQPPGFQNNGGPNPRGQNRFGPNQPGNNPPGQNQPGNTQPGQNQQGNNAPGQNRPDQGRVEIINVNDKTVFIVPGKTNATWKDLKTGDRVLADVPNKQKFAALVMSMPAQIDKDNVTLGQVTSNTNGTLTLRTPGNGDTISTTSATQVFKLAKDGVTAGAVSDLQNGSMVFALGKGSNDEFIAQVIFTLPKGALDNNNPPGNGNNNRKNFPPPQQNQGG